jgi:NTE family protein
LNGHDRHLLDEVDIISAVSGGSFTAAYYGLFGDRIFTEFEQRYLKQNVRNALLTRMLSPINWLRLASPYFHRSDLAAEYYDKHIFDGGTFADISARGTRIIINATDMTDGARFGFDPEQFRLIGSDLMSFPVSRAVAASSAVPVILSPITLRNYAAEGSESTPNQRNGAMKTRLIVSENNHQTTSTSTGSYLNRKDQPYIHLYDGGVSDNLGLRAIIDTVRLAGGASQAMLQYEEIAKAKRVIFIVVNAKTPLDRSWAQSGRGPSVKAVLFSSTNVQLNRYSFETIALLRASFQEWKQQIAKSRCSVNTKAIDNACNDLRFYLVEVSFDALADRQEKTYLERLSSTVTLPAADVDRLRNAAAQILEASTEFNMFLQDMDRAQSAAPP